MKSAQREAFPADMCNLTTEKRETCWNEKPLEDVEHLSQGDIQWHFNPSASPHFGGIWVKVRVRVSLRVRVREPLVHNRPLTKVSSESGLEAITPNHFLISCANPLLPCGVYSGKEISSKKRCRQKLTAEAELNLEISNLEENAGKVKSLFVITAALWAESCRRRKKYPRKTYGWGQPRGTLQAEPFVTVHMLCTV